MENTSQRRSQVEPDPAAVRELVARARGFTPPYAQKYFLLLTQALPLLDGLAGPEDEEDLVLALATRFRPDRPERDRDLTPFAGAVRLLLPLAPAERRAIVDAAARQDAERAHLFAQQTRRTPACAAALRRLDPRFRAGYEVVLTIAASHPDGGPDIEDLTNDWSEPDPAEILGDDPAWTELLQMYALCLRLRELW